MPRPPVQKESKSTQASRKSHRHQKDETANKDPSTSQKRLMKFQNIKKMAFVSFDGKEEYDRT